MQCRVEESPCSSVHSQNQEDECLKTGQMFLLNIFEIIPAIYSYYILPSLKGFIDETPNQKGISMCSAEVRRLLATMFTIKTRNGRQVRHTKAAALKK